MKHVLVRIQHIMTPFKAPSCSDFRRHVKDSEVLSARLLMVSRSAW